MNAGKQFEKDFIDSLPKEIFRYRLRDGTASWGGQSDNVRFQATNICDFILHNGRHLFLLEMKSHKGKSIPYSCFRKNQIEGLINASNYHNIMPYFVINFRDVNETYAILAIWIDMYIKEMVDKKSIPIAWIKERSQLIPQTLKKVHYSYDLSIFKGVS